MNPKASEKQKFRWYDPILMATLIPLAVLITRLHLFTCRVIKVEGKEKEEEALVKTGGKALYATWHQRIFYHIRPFVGSGLVVMASASRDGEYGISATKWIGVNAVRGSSTRGGASARRELTQILKDGAIGGMLADGPRGPARISKIGSVLIARDAQIPLIPITWSADRCWILNSWDRSLIPKPFSRVVYYYADPIWIPPSADGEDLETYRRLFDEELNDGTRWCDEQFGSERPWRKVKKEGVPEVGPYEVD